MERKRRETEEEWRNREESKSENGEKDMIMERKKEKI